MKFTTLIPTKKSDGAAVKPSVLSRCIDNLWRPFSGMTNEGLVAGHWIDENGVTHSDVSVKVSIECDRNQLGMAILAVRKIGRKLGQKAMYFEVSGYDGVQILRIE